VNLVKETKIVLNIIVLYLPLPIYWAVYMMQGSRWIFQATRMNNDIGFYKFQPDQIIVLNPLFIILTLPVCDYVLFPLLKKLKLGSLLQKMTIGGLLGVVATSISVFIEMKIQSNSISISILWLIPQYLIFAISDNFLFVSQLNFVYTEASPSMKSVMMSTTYVVMAIGNLIVVLVSGMKLFKSQANELIFFAAILLIAMIVFAFLASRYKPADHERKSDQTINLDEKVTLMETENKC
jgi:dipeptide/tripeptide permease